MWWPVPPAARDRSPGEPSLQMLESFVFLSCVHCSMGPTGSLNLRGKTNFQGLGFQLQSN